MKTFVSTAIVLSMALLCQIASAESMMDVISSRLDFEPMTIGEKLRPLQAPPAPQMIQKQAPELQAPSKFALQSPLQAPSKLSQAAVLSRPRKVHTCTLIPGRARRLAKRADRLQAAQESRDLKLASRTLLEPVLSDGRVLMEGASCASCNTSTSVVPVQLTSLTTRELLEGGSITQQIRTVNEPGVCGANGCSGGRRGVLRRR